MFKKLNLLTFLTSIIIGFFLSACTAGTFVFPDALGNDAPISSQIVGDLNAADVAAADSTTVSGIQATIITQGSRANFREGPGLEFPIIGKGNPQAELTVVGRSEDGEWWQICCTTDEGGEFEEGLTAWVASSVVTIAGSAGDVPTADSTFGEDLFARWDVNWECGSNHCEVDKCTATVEASVGDVSGGQWLRMDHRVLWDETCFSTDEWVFEVNRFTGLERNSEQNESFLYRYWVGPKPGASNKIFELADGTTVAANCTGPHEVEVEEGEGWTTVYTGYTCHEARTGILLSLSYEKRWLFTGEFEGQTYEREYFDDYEIMEQNLVETTAQLTTLDE